MKHFLKKLNNRCGIFPLLPENFFQSWVGNIARGWEVYYLLIVPLNLPTSFIDINEKQKKCGMCLLGWYPVLIARAPDRDVPIDQKPDLGIAIRRVSCIAPERCGSDSKGNPQQ